MARHYCARAAGNLVRCTSVQMSEFCTLPKYQPHESRAAVSSVVMNRIGRGAMWSTTHSGLKPNVSSMNSSGTYVTAAGLSRRSCRLISRSCFLTLSLLLTG
jgi:hypothetical protein